MDTRERLIETAREIFWERGYSATSPQAILRRAGVGQGSMYHHFTGKADLAATALQRNSEELRHDTAEMFDAATTPLDAVLAYVTRERPALKGCNLGRMTQDPEVLGDERMRAPIAETLGWYQERLAELLTSAQKAGELRPDFSPLAVATTITAVVQGAYVLARAEQSAAPFERAIQGAVQLIAALRTGE